MENNKSVVIFDCDGVMFDSRQANINFYNHLLARFNLPPMNERQIEHVHMHTADESVAEIFKDTPYQEAAQEYRLKLDYTPFINDMIMEPGLRELLEELKPGYGLGVATNRSNTINIVLETFELEGYFDIVVSSLDVSRPKPHPEALLKIADYFEVRPEECLYVGDSLVDYETAHAAGVPFAAYKNNALEASWRLNSLLEIKGILF